MCSLVGKINLKAQNPLNSFIQKYVEWSTSLYGRAILISSLTVITVFLGWNTRNIDFDFEFEKFFPKDHPESRLYLEHVEQFGYDNDFLHIILQNSGSVFDTSFLRRASAFEESLLKLDHVERTYSPLSLFHVIKSPTGLIVFPLIHTDDQRKLAQDSARVYGNEFYRAAFSEKGDAISIYLNHDHFNDPEISESLLSNIEAKAREFELEHVRLVGKLSASGVFIRYIQEDFGKFLIGSLILSFGLLLVIFRKLQSAILPFVISLLSIIWLFGLMGLLGVKINLLTSLIPPILFFVSMSDAVHLMNAVSKSEESDQKRKLVAGVQIVWLPTMLTSVTTAIGFLSLLWINTIPVQTLGIFTSIGILFAFMITFSLGVMISSTSKSGGVVFFNASTSYAKFLHRHSKKYWLAASLVVALLIPGLFQLEINAYLLDDLPPDSQVRKDFDYTDINLGGSKPYEIRVEVADSALSVWDKEVMDEIVKIEEYLLRSYPVTKVQSPATIVKYLTMANNGGLNENYAYPTSEREYQTTLRLKNRIDPKRMNKLVTEDGKVARLIGFFPELGSKETGRRNRKMLDHLKGNIDQSLLRYHITGTTYLIDKSHELLSRNLLLGLVTAVLIIGALLGMYFRSWKLLVISLIPNLIPLLMVAGIIGWFGISLKMTTSIIFAVTFGIAVDDTIHVMSGFLHSKIKDPDQRLAHTFKHAGNAVIITTVIMCAGFCLFLFSNFGATYYLGLFILISLIAALLVDLTILPLLLLHSSKNAAERRPTS